MADSESRCAAPRGTHRLYLGYAPGVGKTYAMLVEARLRAARGEGVVVGYLGPHVRPETKKLSEGMETIAPLRVVYHGSEFAELDTDAVVARHPEWAVIDELAHSNVPGMECEKRWQCVEQILNAGIGVLSTLNVQHVESLNDYVYQVSGVRVAETIPDEFVDAADVIVVDIDPEDLLVRLKHGAVMPADEVRPALMHFFRKRTLVALRERALAVRSSHSRIIGSVCDES
ncbi:MAG: hypothetical protein P4L93_10160 [Coriobacteriia bacterium]|nr:hypothetical protein [Coriobacteriia bacterium]